MLAVVGNGAEWTTTPMTVKSRDETLERTKPTMGPSVGSSVLLMHSFLPLARAYIYNVYVYERKIYTDSPVTDLLESATK